MSGKSGPAKWQGPRHVPATGTLVVDARNRVGEFRGAECGYWYLRPVTGGIEWQVTPGEVRPASPAQRLQAETARADARSRGELLRSPTRRFAFFNWTLRPDLDSDASPTTYVFRCLTLKDDDTECAATSPRSECPSEPQTWAFAHMREHPGHTSYAEEIERPWVMWRGDPT
ncbi:DUF7848 domain-containing protein [Streptomyces sp. HUAS TT20]|uniref:DUF7848 domain-containing protein n=1 Tax=Streptomyces sp. HUAS TT20 TaxID=3447509 RepID=UPI002953066F|nr:hypothetical protein [Streptomyces sp. HUAS 15-9]